MGNARSGHSCVPLKLGHSCLLARCAAANPRAAATRPQCAKRGAPATLDHFRLSYSLSPTLSLSLSLLPSLSLPLSYAPPQYVSQGAGKGLSLIHAVLSLVPLPVHSPSTLFFSSQYLSQRSAQAIDVELMSPTGGGFTFEQLVELGKRAGLGPVIALFFSPTIPPFSRLIFCFSSWIQCGPGHHQRVPPR